MAPPRKKPLPPGAKPAPRKGSVSSAGGTHKHSSSRSKSSSAAAAAAAAALAAGTSSSTSRSKPKSKSSRVAVEQPPLPAFERMDNGMRFSSFPVVYNINQKNYYTDYLKKDDQVLEYIDVVTSRYIQIDKLRPMQKTRKRARQLLSWLHRKQRNLIRMRKRRALGLKSLLYIPDHGILELVLLHRLSHIRSQWSLHDLLLRLLNPCLPYHYVYVMIQKVQNLYLEQPLKKALRNSMEF
jgi:hypothetical protein